MKTFQSQMVQNYESSLSNVHNALKSDYGLQIEYQKCSELSDRELLCLALTATGCKSQRIAWDLGLKVTTIETYMKRVREKLSAKNKVNAFYIAVQRGYIKVI